MADNIQLHALIEALADAVIEAQDSIERHQISNLLGYFDQDNRPRSLVVRLPSIQPDAEQDAEDFYRAPLLPLISTNPLRIKDVEVSFDVELGPLMEQPAKDTKRASIGPEDKEPPRNNLAVNLAGGKRDQANRVHIVLRVENSEPTDGAARLMSHLSQTQGVFKTIKVE